MLLEEPPAVAAALTTMVVFGNDCTGTTLYCPAAETMGLALMGKPELSWTLVTLPLVVVAAEAVIVLLQLLLADVPWCCATLSLVVAGPAAMICQPFPLSWAVTISSCCCCCTAPELWSISNCPPCRVLEAAAPSAGPGEPILLQVAASRARGDGWVSYPHMHSGRV